MRGSDTLFWIVMAVLAIGLIALMFTHDSGQVLGLPSSQFASMVALSALGLVFGAGFLRRAQGNGSHTLQQVALWLALFVALVVGYKLYNGEALFPSDAPSLPNSGTGITVFLMDGIDGGLHLGRPFHFG